MKIVSSGRVLNSPEFYRKKQKRKRLRLILASIGLVLLLSSLIYLSRHQWFLINKVAVVGEDVIDKAEIEKTTRDMLTGYYLWIFPRANSLIYPEQDIESALLKKFPRFQSVDLDLKGLKTLNITVKERVPFALYCPRVSKCYFLDKEGLIFALAPSFTGTVYFLYTTEDKIENPIGERFMSVEEFKTLPKFIETLTTLGIHSKALEVGKSEYRLSLQTDGEVIWPRDSDLAVIYSNLEAFLSSKPIKGQSNFLNKILYLDLRTDNKVFYRFRE